MCVHLHGETFKFWSIKYEKFDENIKFHGFLTIFPFFYGVSSISLPFPLGKVSIQYISIKYSIFHIDKMHGYGFYFLFFFAALNERRKKRRQEKIMIYCNDKTVNSNANWICLPEISFQLCICRDPWLSKQIEQFKKNCIAYTRKPERCNLIRYWSLPLLHPFLYLFLFSLHANLYPNEIYFG